MNKILAFIMMSLFSFNVFCQADIDGFRGKKWDTPFSEMSDGLKTTKSATPGFKGYEKENDNLSYEGIKAHSIIYLFKKDLFTGVSIGIYKKDVDLAVKTLTKKYGEPRFTETPFLNNWEWYLKSSVIALSFFPTNESEESASIGIRKPK